MDGNRETFETVLDLCRVQYCRIVLALLASQRRSLTLRDLSNEIAERDPETPSADAPGDDLEAVYHSLHHVHIPRLADRGVVEYDRERLLIEPTEKIDELQPHLSTILEADPDLDFPAAE